MKPSPTQVMELTAPPRSQFSALATTPCRGLSLSRYAASQPLGQRRWFSIRFGFRPASGPACGMVSKDCTVNMDFSPFTHGLLIRKDLKQEGWISPEIDGPVLTPGSDRASCDALAELFYLLR
jgi:hypothetical protein